MNWVCEGRPTVAPTVVNVIERQCKETHIRIILKDLTPSQDVSRGRNINGRYKKMEGDKNGHPFYEFGENRIWYCREWECLFDGWVLGKKTRVVPSDRLFSQYAETNGYRLG